MPLREEDSDTLVTRISVLQKILDELKNKEISQFRKWELETYIEFIGKRITEEHNIFAGVD